MAATNFLDSVTDEETRIAELEEENRKLKAGFNKLGRIVRVISEKQEWLIEKLVEEGVISKN